MFRALAIAALACLPLPAAAQDMPLVDHVATMFLGLQAGYRAAMGELAVPVKQLGPGVFELASEGQRTVISTFTELEPCVFNYEARRGTRAPVSFQLHIRKLGGVIYNQRKTNENGLTLFILEVESQPGFIMRDGKPEETRFLMQNLTTDVPLAALDASVAALKQACPTGDATEGMTLVDHVASAIFGFQHGYHIPLGGSAVTVLRTSPGVFDIVDRGSVTAKFSVSEVETCMFELAFTYSKLLGPKSRIDATRLNSISYTPTKTDERKLTTYVVSGTFDPGFNVQINPDGTTTPDDDLVDDVRTDAPLQLLEASVSALLAACP